MKTSLVGLMFEIHILWVRVFMMKAANGMVLLVKPVTGDPRLN